MTMTPERLREIADSIERYIQAGCPEDAQEPGGDPDQLRAHADALEEIEKLTTIAHKHGWNGVENSKILATFFSDALEELERVKDELLGVKEYREKNPLGGPAKVFDAMADQIRAGDDFNKVIADYGWCPSERAEAALAECRAKLEVDPRTKYDGIDCRDETIRLLEAALAEAERKGEAALEEIERLKKDRDEWKKDATTALGKINEEHIRANNAESALAEAERKCERLKFHAEAMAETLDKWAAIDQCKCSSVDAYRAEFKEE